MKQSNTILVLLMFFMYACYTDSDQRSFKLMTPLEKQYHDITVSAFGKGKLKHLRNAVKALRTIKPPSSQLPFADMGDIILTTENQLVIQDHWSSDAKRNAVAATFRGINSEWFDKVTNTEFAEPTIEKEDDVNTIYVTLEKIEEDVPNEDTLLPMSC